MASFSNTAVVFSVEKIQFSDRKVYHDDGVEYSVVPALLVLSIAGLQATRAAFVRVDGLSQSARSYVCADQIVRGRYRPGGIY